MNGRARVAILLRELTLQLLGDHVHLGSCRIDGHAWPEPREYVQIAVAPIVVSVFIAELERRPELRLAGRERKRRGHHADDDVRHLVESHRLAENVVAPAELGSPQPIAQDDGARRAEIVLFVVENASEKRAHAEHTEDFCARRRTIEPPRLGPADHVRSAAGERPHRLERPVHALPVEIVGR